MAARRVTYPPARLYEAILHLRQLGHVVSCHNRRRRLHRLDDAILTEDALMERAMGAFRRKLHDTPPPSDREGH
ncbi:MAG TPA: hypothetical protein VD978_28455 [Azospirillum sp.]|nr:hypothetical protein [Azospirillum sp.]